MRYTALIHHLLVASEEAKRTNTDVAERLKGACVNGINLIRETLMNSVCDPRFKMHVEVIPGWRKLAQRHLENFAERLMTISDLDEGRAYYEMDKMLDQWLTLATTVAEEHDKNNVSYTEIPKDKNENYLYIKRNLEHYVYDDEEELFEELNADELDEILSDLSWDDGDDSTKVEGDDEEEFPMFFAGDHKTLLNKDEEEKVGSSDNDEEKKDEEFGPNKKSGKKDCSKELEFSPRQGDGSQGMGIGGGVVSKVELQNRFLSNVPQSLIELAKRIGRSGENIYETSGSFVSSSKSDITGITIGDNLSNLLPSELAMLAEPATRDIFYRNFVTKRLQVFASQSSGKKGKKKHDGPIVICLDTSSSMQGEPVLVAKALSIAICIIAQRRKRKVLVVKYSYSHDLFRLHNIEHDKKDLLDFLGEAEMGGNDEDGMFRWLFDDIMPFEGDYSTADILCISDFGWMPISEEVMEKINAEKQKGMTFYGLNVVDPSTMGQYMRDHMEKMSEFLGSPANVCDSMWEYKNGVCKETKKIENKQ
ncbi:MAG: hypothetical protein IKX59_08845 [Bacteroidales bacterium]|nr:hypothetical protein [Bacteroidales bacterium]